MLKTVGLASTVSGCWSEISLDFCVVSWALSTGYCLTGIFSQYKLLAWE